MDRCNTDRQHTRKEENNVFTLPWGNREIAAFVLQTINSDHTLSARSARRMTENGEVNSRKTETEAVYTIEWTDGAQTKRLRLLNMNLNTNMKIMNFL